MLFHKFRQIRRNESRQSIQLYVTFHVKLYCSTIQEKNDMIHLGLKLQYS